MSRCQRGLARCTVAVAIHIALVMVVGDANAQEKKVPQEELIAFWEGHKAPVRTVIYAPDGKTLVSADAAGVVIVWDRESGKPIRTIREHAAAVLDLAMTPDGLHYISAGLDRTLKFHDLPRRAALASGVGFTNDPTCVAVSADGKFVVTGDKANVVRLSNPLTMAPVRNFAGSPAPITAVALSPDAKHVLAAAADGSLRGWVTASAASIGAWFTPPAGSVAFHPGGKFFAAGGNDGILRVHRWPPLPPRTLATHAAHVTAVTISADGKLIVSGSTDQTVRVYRGEDGLQLRQLAGQSGPVTSIAIHELVPPKVVPPEDVNQPRALAVASGSATGLVHIWNSRSGQMTGTLAGHAGASSGVAFHPNGKQIASVGVDGTLRIWRLPTPPSVFQGHSGPIADLDLGAKGKVVATVSGDKTLSLWNVADGERLLAIPNQHPGGVRTVAMSRDGEILATGDPLGVIRVFNQADGKLLGQIVAHAGAVNRLAFHPKDKHLYSVGADGALKSWRLPLVDPLSFPGHTALVRTTAISRDGKLVVSGGDDKSVRFFDGETGKAVKVIENPGGAVMSLALSPDASLTAGVDAGGLLTIWKSADAAPIVHLRGHAGIVHAVAWHPLGKQLATAGADGTIHLWELPGEPALLAGHAKAVSAVSVSPNGQLLASASADGTVRLWNLANRKFVRALQGHGGPVTSLAWKADSTQLVTGSADKTVRLWNVANGQEVKKFEGSDGEIHAVAISRDGTRIAAGGADKLGRIWNVADGKETALLEGHTGAITALIYSPKLDEFVTASADGTLRTWKKVDGAAGRTIQVGSATTSLSISADGTKLITAAADKNIKVFNAGTGAVEATIAGSDDVISDVSFSRDGKLIAASSADGSLRLLDLKGVELQRFSLGDTKATSVAFAPDGDSLLVGGADNKVRVFRRSLLRVITGHQGTVHCLAFTPDGKQLLSGGADKTLRLWNLADGKQVRAYAGHAAIVSSVAINAKGTLVVAGGADKTVRTWNFANAAAGVVFTHAAAVRSVSVSSDGARVAAGGDDNLIRVWDLASAQELQQFPGHTAAVHGIAFAGDDKTLVSCSADMTVRRWSVSAEQVLLAHKGKANDLVLTPDGSHRITAGDDNLVKLWDAQGKLVRQFTGSATPLLRVAVSRDGTKLAAGGDPLFTAKDLFVWNLADAKVLSKVTLPAAITAVAFSDDNLKAAAGCSDQHVRVIRLVDGRLLEDLATAAPITDLAFTADHQSLIVAGADNNLRVYQTSLLHLLTGHQGAVSSVAFTPDGKSVVTAGIDKTVRLWDLASGKELRQFAGSTAAVHRVAVSPDGKIVVAAGDDKNVRLWNLADGKSLANIALPAGARSVAFTGDSRRLIVGGGDNLIRIYDLVIDPAAPVLLEQFPGHTAAVLAVAASSNGGQIVSGGMDNTARLWTTSVVSAAKAHQGPIHAVLYSYDGASLYTAGEDKTVAAWQSSDLEPVRKLAGNAGAVRALGISADGKMVAAAGDDAHIRLWNTADGALLADLTAPAKLTSLVLGPDGSKVIVSGADYVLRNYAVRKVEGKLQLTLTQEGHGHTAAASALALSGNGDWLFSVSADRTLKRWFAASYSPRWSADVPQGPIYSIAINKNGTHIATGGGDKMVRLWDARDGNPLAEFIGHQRQVFAVAFSPDGTRLASTGLDKTVRVWDLAGKIGFRFTEKVADVEMADGKVVKGVVADGLYSLAFSRDSRYLAAGGLSTIVSTWDLSADPPSDKPLRSVRGHSETIYRVSYNYANTRIATIDYSAKLFIWNAPDGALVYHQQLPASSAFSLAYSPDGKEIAVATRDHRLMIVALPAGAR